MMESIESSKIKSREKAMDGSRGVKDEGEGEGKGEGAVGHYPPRTREELLLQHYCGNTHNTKVWRVDE